MGYLKLTGQNLCRFFNTRVTMCMPLIMNFNSYYQTQCLKLAPNKFLGSLPLDIVTPGQKYVVYCDNFSKERIFS